MIKTFPREDGLNWILKVATFQMQCVWKVISNAPHPMFKPFRTSRIEHRGEEVGHWGVPWKGELDPICFLFFCFLTDMRGRNSSVTRSPLP